MQNDTFQSFQSEPGQAPEAIEEAQESEVEKAKEQLQGAEKKSIKIPVKTIVIAAIIVAVGVLGYFLKGLFIAATVDGSPISRFEVIGKLEKVSGKDLLDSLITEKLILNEAKEKGINITKEEIDAEIKKVQDQITAQGGKFEEVLATQKMSVEDLRARIILQKSLGKMLSDKLIVSDQEVDKYITDNKVELPKGQEAAIKSQIKDSLVGQKLNTEAPILIDNLKTKAKIRYFVNY